MNKKLKYKLKTKERNILSKNLILLGLMKMEEIFENFKSFADERKNLQEQINQIERKRIELAEERNAKKAINKINNDEELCSEVNCLGRQISDLGNQSQWFQNQIDKKSIEIKKQAYLEIDSLIAEEMRKIRIINEQIEDNENCSNDINIIYDGKNNIQKMQESISDFLWIKKMIRYGEIYQIIAEVSKENQTIETKENIENVSNIQENELEEIKLEVEPLTVEKFEPQLEKVELENLNIEKFEVPEEPKIEDIIIEEFKNIQEDTQNNVQENVLNVQEETNNLKPTSTDEKEYEGIEDEIIRTLQEQLAKEKEIITFEESNKKIEEKTKITVDVKLQNIVIKIENKTIVYKVQYSDGTEINIYPIEEKLYNDEKESRNKWKEIIVKYVTSTYKNFYNYTIRKMDPVVCEIINQFAKRYNKNSAKILYNYVMSFSNQKINVEELPKIIYNLSYLNELEISRNDLRTVQKIVKNASKNILIETIGTITFVEKVKYFARKLLNINNIKLLSEGNKENL